MADIRLYGFGTLSPLLDLSPFVAKLEAYLHLAGVEFEKRAGDIRKAPRGKLPFIRHGEEVVTDSQGVIDYLREENRVKRGRRVD